MLKYLKRILFFLSLLLLYVIGKEVISLYAALKALHPYAAYGFLLLSAFLLVYYALIPAFKIWKIPRSPGPLGPDDDVQRALPDRFARLRKNPYLLSIDYDFSEVPETAEGYETIMQELRKESARIRNRYVNNLFYSSTISQNGFIDAILILSASVNLVKDTFVLYNGRVSNGDLWIIARQVYYSVAIGGSDSMVYATDEIFSKISTEGMKGIPFLDKIISSLVDGFVNAALLTRVALITDNYCSKLVVQSKKELYPSPAFIVETVSNITGTIRRKLFGELRAMAGSGIKNLTSWAVNPVKVLFEKIRFKPDAQVELADDQEP